MSHGYRVHYDFADGPTGPDGRWSGSGSGVADMSFDRPISENDWPAIAENISQQKGYTATVTKVEES